MFRRKNNQHFPQTKKSKVRFCFFSLQKNEFLRKRKLFFYNITKKVLFFVSLRKNYFSSNKTKNKTKNFCFFFTSAQKQNTTLLSSNFFNFGSIIYVIKQFTNRKRKRERKTKTKETKLTFSYL